MASGSTKRNVVVSAVALTLECPICGTPQPSPEGSHMWLPSQVEVFDGMNRDCVSCGTLIVISLPRRVVLGNG